VPGKEGSLERTAKGDGKFEVKQRNKEARERNGIKNQGGDNRGDLWLIDQESGNSLKKVSEPERVIKKKDGNLAQFRNNLNHQGEKRGGHSSQKAGLWEVPAKKGQSRGGKLIKNGSTRIQRRNTVVLRRGVGKTENV